MSGLAAAAVAIPDLGTAGSFGVLSSSTVTNSGLTAVDGDLGVSPGTSVTGFPPGIVNGTIHAGDAVALQAQNDATTAYDYSVRQACDFNLSGQDLGDMTLIPGVYCFNTSAQLTGHLTLSGRGNPNSVFIFQIGSTLTTASNAAVDVISSAQPCSIFWQIGSVATLGANTDFAGNILAYTSITLNTGATVNGGLYALNGAVTLGANTVAACGLAQSPTTTPTQVPTYTPTSTLTPTATPTTCEQVIFNNTVNVTITGNTIQKTGGAGSTWDAGGISAQNILAIEGSVQATVDSLQTYRMFGLSHGNHNVNFNDIQFAAYLAGNTLKIYESGLYKGTFGTLAVSDTVTIAVYGGLVRYYLNTTPVYTSATVPTFPLNLDSSINSLAGRISNVMICGASISTDPTSTTTSTFTASPTRTRTVTSTNTSTVTRTNTSTRTPIPAPTWACTPVTWTNMVNVAAIANTIRKTGGTASTWDAGATSSQRLICEDGYGQVSVVETNTYAMFGLDQVGTMTSSSDTDFALFMAGGTLKVYERGVLRGNFGSYTIGDVLKVSSVRGIVRYWRNDVLLYTSAVSPNNQIQMNTAINSMGGRIANAYMCPLFGFGNSSCLETSKQR